MASISLYKSPTGTYHAKPDEYLNAPIWVSAQTGRVFTRPHTLVNPDGALMFVEAPETVETRPVGMVKSTPAGHTKSFLEEKGLTPALVERNTVRWLSELQRGVEQSQKRRAGSHKSTQGRQPTPTVAKQRPKTVQEMLAEITGR